MKTIVHATGVLAIALLCGCEHKDLCYIHDEHALKHHAIVATAYQLVWQHTIGNATDWQTQWPEEYSMEYNSLRPEIPKGLRVLVYNDDGKFDIVNRPPECGHLPMSAGEHALMFFNNDTEFIVFEELGSTVSARATTRTRATYVGNSYIDNRSENTVSPPDMLFGSYVEAYSPERTPEPEPLPVTMKALVFTYLVRYEFAHGLTYVALARGALAGMANSVYLNNGRTSEEEATMLYDCSVEDFGTQALVKSFGIPDYPDQNDAGIATDRRYALNLEVRLRNGAIKSFDFDVTDQVAAQPRGGVIVVKGIEISDDEGLAGGSGFDVIVDGWGEYEDIEFPL